MHPSRESRPWTIYALTALNTGWALWGLVFDDAITPLEVALVLFGAWITYSIWTAKTWAFTFSFMTSSLCAGLLVTVGVVQVLLLEQGADDRLLWALVPSAILIGLLMHPATKRFARI